MAIGLFDAGLLGAICLSLASSWAFGEVFGWVHSLNNKIKKAPWFYASYMLALVTAGLVVLIPNAPLVLITLFVQVVAVTLLPAALVFLILLLNEKEVMGAHANTPLLNWINGGIVGVIIVISTFYGARSARLLLRFFTHTAASASRAKRIDRTRGALFMTRGQRPGAVPACRSKA